MNRREFLGNSALMSLPLFLQGIPVFAKSDSLHPFLEAIARSTDSCDKILVIIQLNGGNDGLSSIIPIDKYAELNIARKNILVPEASVLKLSGNDTTGMHPSMAALRDLYNDGKVTLVQGVSYPNPNFSHFQAQDIWFAASNSSTPAGTGWLGRELDKVYPDYPTGYPNDANPDPPAIQIGGALPLLLHGPNGNLGYNAPNPDALIKVVTAAPAPAPVSDYGTELTFLRMMKDQSNAYTARISSAYNAQKNLSTTYAAPNTNTLSDQLQVVARLIGGGLRTPVYVVNHPDSFDTHVKQVEANDTKTGDHAKMLSKLSVAIAAFQNDLKLMGKADKVTGMTFSEFGRRVMSNASLGTDHGTAAPVIFFGAGVKGGMIGASPNLPGNPDPSSQIPLQFDFRQVYATVMQDWLCMTPTQSSEVLDGTYKTVPIFVDNPLPVDTISPTVKWEGNNAKIEFEVVENDKYFSYTLERSIDGTNFTSIETIQNVSEGTQMQYTFLNERISAEKIYYRIKCVTKRETIVYSAIAILLSQSQSQKISIFPNPVTNHTINIDFFEQVTDNIEIAIYSMRGDKLWYDQINLQGKGRTIIKVSDMFGPGMVYLLKVSYAETEITEKIIFR